MVLPSRGMSESAVRALKSGDEFWIVGQNRLGKWLIDGPCFLVGFWQKDMDGPTTTMIRYKDKKCSAFQVCDEYFDHLCWHSQIFGTAKEARSYLRWRRKHD